MRRPGPHFGDHPGLRSGVFYFLLLLSLLQAARYAVSRAPEGLEGGVRPDSLLQARLDSLRGAARRPPPREMRPVEANRLNDYQGYLLGIPPRALDSLYAFRERGGTLADLEAFRKVSGLADSTVRRLAPWLRFPRPAKNIPGRGTIDLNKATALQLQAVRGIGPVLSRRIIRFREALGGFLDPAQLHDVYGLDPEVAQRVMQAFPLRQKPAVRKISLNAASVEELASLVYLTRPMAEEIVRRREARGPFRSLGELREIRSIPENKIERIALYLGL